MSNSPKNREQSTQLGRLKTSATPERPFPKILSSRQETAASTATPPPSALHYLLKLTTRPNRVCENRILFVTRCRATQPHIDMTKTQRAKLHRSINGLSPQDVAGIVTIELLATGQVSAALEALQQQGRVKEIPNAEDRVRAIAKTYVESPQNTLIVSPDNASRRELNVAVRQDLKLIGTLATEDHAFRVLVQRQDMTGAERSWANHYEVNDIVRYTRGSKAIGIGAGAYASVVAIDPAPNLLTVEKANHELATYDPRRLTGVSVYQEIDREFSVGERIQFTAPDKSLGIANRDLAVIEAIHPDGRVTAILSDDRQIEFNAREHPHFDHGYAVTSHSSQGLTAERVLVHADTSVHPDLLNSRFAYVSVSRASHDAVLFTDDVAKLGPQLGADVSKTSALEINQASSIIQGIGLGL